MLPAPLNDPKPFLDKIFNKLIQINLKVSQFELDHICYRVENVERYEQIKQILTDNAEFLSEEIISNRPISTFKLFEPIIYKNRKIYLIELPSPKAGKQYLEGYEHAEFVIEPMSFADIMAKYPKLDWQTHALSKAINPDISLQFNGFSIKFHQKNLEEVIKFEQSLHK